MISLKSGYWRRRRQKHYSHLTMVDREQKLKSLLLLFVCLVVGHTFAMVMLEGLSPWDALWLTMTTMTTVGYGDISATTVAGRTVTILMMYIFGIFLLAQLAGEWIDFRMERRDKMRRGDWRWNMIDHIVIINTPDKDGSRYLRLLVEQIRKSTSLRDYPIQVFSPNYPDGLPNELASLGVVLKQGEPEGRASLEEADVQHAAFVIVLAVDVSDYRSDSLTLDILDQLKEFDLPGHVIAECLQDENRSRLINHGANAVLRPVRAYPELLVRAIAAPGTEVILENLFEHHGVHPHRYEVDIPSQSWGQLASRVLLSGLGTPLAYLDMQGQVITNPSIDEEIQGKALFVIVNHDVVPEASQIIQCVSQVD